jgi:hypothetical protein
MRSNNDPPRFRREVKILQWTAGTRPWRSLQPANSVMGELRKPGLASAAACASDGAIQYDKRQTAEDDGTVVAQRGGEQTGGHDACIGRYAVVSGDRLRPTALQAATPSGVCSTVAREPCPCGTLNLIPPVLSIRELHTSALRCSKPSGITI